MTHTKDKALKLLDALKVKYSDVIYSTSPSLAAQFENGIAGIEQALAHEALDKNAENARELGLDYEPVLKDNSNYRYDPPVAEPVVWKWHQAPAKTSWGHDMVVADLAIDKDNTASVYCERDQTAKVEAMLNPPAAPVQEPVDRNIITRFLADKGVYLAKESIDELICRLSPAQPASVLNEKPFTAELASCSEAEKAKLFEELRNTRLAPVLSAGPITPEMANWSEADKAKLVSVIEKHAAQPAVPLTREQCLHLEVHPMMTIEQVVRVVEAAHGITKGQK